MVLMLLTFQQKKVMKSIADAYKGTDADGKERGFMMGTDGSVSSTKIGSAGNVGTDKTIKEMQNAGKTISGSVHTHGEGKVTISADGKSFNGEGSHLPSATGATNDMKSQKSRQSNETYTGPSIVAGTEISVTPKTDGSGHTIKKTKVLTYYDSSCNTSTVNYEKFSKTVKDINK